MTYPKGYTPPPKGYTPPIKLREGTYPKGYTPPPTTQNNNNVEIKYFEDGNVKSAIIDPWSTTLNYGEVLLWRFDHKTKGIFTKRVLGSMVVTNFRLIIIDHEKNVLDMLHLIPNLDDIIVMNTHRVSDSVGYGMYLGGLGGGYMRMAGPRFSSGTSKTIGDIIFIQNTLKSSWGNIPDPTGLKNFIKSIKKTMYDPLTKLQTKPPRGGITCPNCGLQNPKNAQFCSGCGSQLLPMCSNCKQRNPIGASFCNKCGSQLSISYTVELSDKGASEVVEQSFRECIMKEHNIKINYPSTWTRTFDINPPNPQTKVNFYSPKEGPTDQTLDAVSISLDDTIGNMTLDAYIEGNITGLSQGNKNFKLFESKPTTLSGVPAHQIVFFANQWKVLTVVAIKNNVAYSIMYLAEPSKYLKFLSSAEQMISSFEFLD